MSESILCDTNKKPSMTIGLSCVEGIISGDMAKCVEMPSKYRNILKKLPYAPINVKGV